MLAGAAALLLEIAGAPCPAAPWDDMIALTPSGTTMVVWTDLTKARTSPLWRRVEADTRWKTLAGCDLDSDELLLALDERGPTAWVLRGGAATRLNRCGGWKVRRADPRTVVLAPPGSARRVPAKARRRSPLSKLMCGVPRASTVAFAATVGPEARSRLKSMPALEESGTLRTVVGGADLGDGLRLNLRARLGSRRAAAGVVQGIAREIDALRRQPMVLLAGLAPILGAVRVRADGADATVEAGMDAAALSRLVRQIEVLSGTSARKP